jgi:hypothetical protein
MGVTINPPYNGTKSGQNIAGRWRPSLGGQSLAVNPWDPGFWPRSPTDRITEIAFKCTSHRLCSELDDLVHHGLVAKGHCRPAQSGILSMIYCIWVALNATTEPVLVRVYDDRGFAEKAVAPNDETEVGCNAKSSRARGSSGP